MSTDHANLLEIYLQDHLAGATAGAERADRLATAEAGSPSGPALATLALEINEDRDALIAVMSSVGVGPSRLKMGVASLAEKVGLLKLNGRISGRSPLSTIVEVEAMRMAVCGKRSLWETLRAASPPTDVDLDALIARADAQLDVLADVHAQHVARTLATALP